MKRAIILLLVWLPLLVTAQVETTTISLKLTDADKADLERSGRKPRIVMNENEIVEAQTDRNGNWHFLLADPEPQYVTLTIWGGGIRTMYLVPGMTTSVSLIPDKGFKYSGDYAAVNNYLNTSPINGVSQIEMGYKEDEYVAKNKEMLDEAYRVLEKAKLDKKFTTLEKQRLHLMFACKLAAYADIYSKVNNVAYTPSQKFKDYVTAQFKEDDKLIGLNEYKQLAWNVLGYNWKAPADAKIREDESISEINFVLDRFKGEKLREHMIGSIVIGHIRNAGLKDTARIEPMFRTYVKKPELIKMHQELCDKLTSDTDKILKKMAAGKEKCPSFKFKDINGKEVALEDFKGKYVYIDCWATWCGPCKAELPALKKLEEKYKNRNIVFVSISSDKDKAAWEKMVKLDNLGGVQLNTDRDNSFHSALKIASIPRFMLIDPEGYFVSDNAPRPSNSQTEILFDSLKGL